MISRNEYFYLKEQLKKKEQAQCQFWLTDEVLKWNKLCHMTPEDRAKLYQEWDKYYSDVKNTPSYVGYRKMKLAFNNYKDQMSKLTPEEMAGLVEERKSIAELRAEATKRLAEGNYLRKPSSVSPYELEKVEDKLKKMQTEIDQDKAVIEDHKAVYERNNETEI